ncbi:hypothetical protein CKA32_007052 [Geitlerinema sp. FC II]|nr:hypothetical protein CKA32_007052 [Geitlerinema sp. FC II]
MVDSIAAISLQSRAIEYPTVRVYCTAGGVFGEVLHLKCTESDRWGN